MVRLQAGQRTGSLINIESNQVTRLEAGGVQEMPRWINTEGTRDWIDLGPPCGRQRSTYLIYGK